MGLKVLVAGSRSIDTLTVVRPVLDDLRWGEPSRIIHGEAKGVDNCARIWAEQNDVFQTTHPVPDWAWEKIGRKAGPLRNEYMVEQADAVVAIWDGESEGTLDVIKKADARGLPLRKVVCDHEGNEVHWNIVSDQYVDDDQANLSEFA